MVGNRDTGCNVHGIAKSHPFVDGNKRTAFVVALTFLVLNGWNLTSTLADRLQKMVALAAGEISEGNFASWLRVNSKPR